MTSRQRQTHQMHTHTHNRDVKWCPSYFQLVSLSHLFGFPLESTPTLTEPGARGALFLLMSEQHGLQANITPLAP